METSLEKYCVYTAGQFNDHAGTSFIVTPQTLGTPAALAEMPRLDPRTEKYLGTTTGSNISKTNPDLKYITRSLPGKGIGVLATQTIRRGEIYMVSHPALIIDTELEKGPDPAIRERDRWALLEMAFTQLGDRERAASLVGSTGGNRWEDIMRTNSFAVNIQGKMCSGLFPEQARLNHACLPNSVIRFIPHTFAMEVMAVRNIEAGEELTISYIPVDLPSAQRAKFLNNSYNFECTCPLCRASDADKAASDSRREKIRNLKGHILSITSKSESESTTSESSLKALANDLFAAVRAEPGLAPLKLREYLGELAVLFAKRGDLETGVEYAQGAEKEAEGLGEDGKGDEPGARMRSNLEFLEKKLAEQKAAQAA